MHTLYYENGMPVSDRGVQRSFGRTMVNNPEELLAVLPTGTDPDDFADALVQHITPQLADHGHHGSIRNALADTIILFDGALDDAPEITKHEALVVARSDMTHFALAELALRSKESLRSFVTSPQRKLIYRINDARTRLILGPALRSEEGGCPYAGRVEETKEQTRDPNPLFLRFAGWVGELAVHRYFGSAATQESKSSQHNHAA